MQELLANLAHTTCYSAMIAEVKKCSIRRLPRRPSTSPFVAMNFPGRIASMACEARIRRALHLKVRPPGEAVWFAVEEFWIPRSNERADVATIGSIIQAFEIKSDRDSLKRLPRQVIAYGRVFDRCTAVLAERHVSRALEILPDWWGVLTITPADTPGFIALRPPGRNNEVESETLVRLLWRDEVHNALTALGVAPDPRASRTSLWEALLRAVDLDALKAIVRHALCHRDPARARIPTRRFSPVEIMLPTAL